MYEKTTDLYISPGYFYGYDGIRKGDLMEQCDNEAYWKPKGQSDRIIGGFMPAEIVLTWNKYYE